MRLTNRLSSFITGLMLVSVSQLSIAADGAFLHTTGPEINGTVLSVGFENWVDINSFAVAGSRSCTRPPGGDLGCSFVNIASVEISKFPDETDADFFSNLANNTNFSNVCMISYVNGGNGIIKRSAIGLGGATITSMSSVGGVEGASRRLSFEYDQISIISYKINPQTGAPDGHVASCFDMKTRVACSTPGDLLTCPQ